MLLASVALRLLESGKTDWWMITVPEGNELAVAKELQEELEVHTGPIFLWPGPSPEQTPVVSLYVIMSDALDKLPMQLDFIRSRMVGRGTLAFIAAENNAGIFLSAAPHVASFIGGKLLETSTDEPPPTEFIERRLNSLRATYGMSDEQARERYKQDQASESIDFLEWMLLLAPSKVGADGE